MRKFIFAALLILTTLPACAAEPERKQETVALGENRFLIFVAEPGGEQFITTIDLIAIEDGIPHFEPIFTQGYDVEEDEINTSEGVAFQAASYHFDTATRILDYTVIDSEKQVRYRYTFHFEDDRFLLNEVTMQKDSSEETTIPKVLYKAGK